ncbi:response regulator [Salinadaptatus halalkaliphilus]|uniref:Response regulator n=1 Tax=Salinadaptatus halalkaliphilus TaxID=2419781 RepID=A0A4V6RUC8_9EURY|nr:winged helix-turn-helix transcriptional regulator [Salinadaptatus halalkaliphilus]THE64457.1 response regulator [Salinadaptatus halalkaliphilus]
MTETPNPAQSIAGSILGTKWKPRLIVALAPERRLGFGECKRELEGISNKVLSNNLEELREYGVVSRDVLQEQPRRVEYELTAAGRELYTILESMADWDATYVVGTGAPTVLLADDQQQLLEIYSVWLAADYDVVTAADGREALALLNESIDVAILDRAMPDLSGEEVLTAVADAGQQTPIAILTAKQVSPNDVSVPADRLLRKPITKDELIDVIAELNRLPTIAPVAREVEARAHRLAFVETHLGSAVKSTEPYRRARKELNDIETERAAATAAREPWRGLLEREDETASTTDDRR